MLHLKKFKSAVVFVLVVTAALSLSMCGKKEADSQGGKPVVKIWTLWTETSGDTNAVTFLELLEKAKTDLPDIIIEHDATENESYKTKLKTALAADEGPDIFFSWGAGFLKPFVDAGKVLPIDDYLTDGTSERIKPGALSFFQFDGKTYGLTMFQWVAILYCNQELFEANGVTMPNTYDELLAAVKAFRAKGINPITVGEKDRWPGMFWQNAFALRTAGAKNNQAALSGQASFDTPEYVQSAALLAGLVENKAFIDGALGLASTEAEAMFLQGEVPMYYMGNWFASNINNYEGDIKDKVVCRKFPSVAGAKGSDKEFLGGSIDGLCVSSQTQNKEATVKVLKYLAENMAIELNKKGALPVWEVSSQGPTDDKLLTQIKDVTSDAENYVLAWDTFLSGAASEKHKDLVAQIFGGKISPEDFAKEMDKLNK